MREENRLKRQADIEKTAYALLKQEGYGSISMLKIAKAAKASNETLYRWYGDKIGLFRALVAKNAAEAKLMLDNASRAGSEPSEILLDLAPVLLGILIGPQAIALNKAAAADVTGELGEAISDEGRKRILPMITAILRDYGVSDEAKAAELYVTLLVGDLQIRRAIGQIPEPDGAFIEERARVAMERFFVLIDREI